MHPTSGRCSNGSVISDRPLSNADPMFEKYGHAQTMRTGVARCYKHDTNTYDVSMGYGFMLLKKEMQTTDKTRILHKNFMSGPQNFI